MVAAGDRIGVAVSGGADSVVLLHVLHSLRNSFDLSLTVLHVNHQLRGPESDGDEAFVRGLADSLRLAVIVEQGPVPAGNQEQEARRVRQRFFRSARTTHSLQRIALGHTRTDQAETILLRFLRGTGLTGLAGMMPVTASGLIRPLLSLSRAEVHDFARVSGLTWREDSSNQDHRFRRNHLRLVTIPRLSREYNPQLEAGLARTGVIVQAEEEFWATHVENLYNRLVAVTPESVTVAVDELNALTVAEARRLIRRCLQDVRGDLRAIDLAHVAAVLTICRSRHGHDRVIIPGVDAIRSFAQLRLATPDAAKQPRDFDLELRLGREVCLPFRVGRLRITEVSTEAPDCVTVKDENLVSAQEEHAITDVCVPPPMVERLRVRNWQPGDRYQRVGSVSQEKIKTMFQEGRVPLWERRHWPVIVAGTEIIWARQFGPAQPFARAPDSGCVLRVRFEAESASYARK